MYKVSWQLMFTSDTLEPTEQIQLSLEGNGIVFYHC